MTGDLILAIETSSIRGSVSLGRGPNLVAVRTLTTERRHTGELLPAIRDLLAAGGVEPCDVGLVCFSCGPGSFTGLRVGATVARMWQSATNCRVAAVPSLEAVAHNALARPECPTRLAVILGAPQGGLVGA